MKIAQKERENDRHLARANETEEEVEKHLYLLHRTGSNYFLIF